MLTNFKIRQPRWAAALLITLFSLMLAGCDTGGGAQGAVVQQPPNPAAPQSSNPPPYATAYWPNGTPVPQAKVVIPAAPALPAAAGRVLLEQSFSAPVNFTVQDLGADSAVPPSTWQVQDGRYVQMGDSAGNPDSFETIALSGDATWGDYRAEVQVFSGATPMGLVVRYSAAGFYRLRVNRSTVTGPGWVLSRYDATKRGYHATDLASGSVGDGYTKLAWNYLALTAQGDKISVSVNGQTTSVTDATYTAGRVGLYTEATGGAFFDNLRVTAQQ